MRAARGTTIATLGILGLCPLAIPADSLVTGAMLGAATLAVTVISLLLPARKWFRQAMRLPVMLLAAAAVTTIVQLLCKAYVFEAYDSGGPLLALVIAAGIVPAALATMPDALASVTPMQALRHGALLALVPLVIGALRGLPGANLSSVPAVSFFLLALLVAACASVAPGRRDR